MERELNLTNETDYDGRMLRGLLKWAMVRCDKERLWCKTYYNRSKFDRVTGRGFYRRPEIELGLRQGETDGITLAQVTIHELHHTDDMQHPEMVDWWEIPVVDVMRLPEKYQGKLHDGRKTRWEQKRRGEQSPEHLSFPLSVKFSEKAWEALKEGNRIDWCPGQSEKRKKFLEAIQNAGQQGNYRTVSLSREAAKFFCEHGGEYEVPYMLHGRTENHIHEVRDKVRRAL